MVTARSAMRARLQPVAEQIAAGDDADREDDRGDEKDVAIALRTFGHDMAPLVPATRAAPARLISHGVDEPCIYVDELRNVQ